MTCVYVCDRKHSEKEKVLCSAIAESIRVGVGEGAICFPVCCLLTIDSLVPRLHPEGERVQLHKPVLAEVLKPCNCKCKNAN